jgi:predicted ArsR family transcriptional regulator
MGTEAGQGWQAVTPLTEPTRRRVYETVRAGVGPSTRDEVATALGIGRKLAAFHLDALAAADLLDVDYARPPGRSGPGAGRPAKRYQAKHDDVTVSVPARRYDLAARILAAGIEQSVAGDARASVLAASAASGRAVAASVSASASTAPDATPTERVWQLLCELGYEPAADQGAIRLQNCPFHAVVDVAPDLVCGMNLALLRGAIGELAASGFDVELEPTPGQCCVAIRERPAR